MLLVKTIFSKPTQSANSCSKLTIGTLEQSVRYVQIITSERRHKLSAGKCRLGASFFAPTSIKFDHSNLTKSTTKDDSTVRVKSIIINTNLN